MTENQPSNMGLLRKAKAFIKQVLGGSEQPLAPLPETPIRVMHRVSIEQNARAARIFITNLRNSNRFHQDPYSGYLIDDRGIRIEPVENGYLSAQDLLNIAQNRYQLPMAMYISRDHARLVLKGPYNSHAGKTIQVYDPMSAGVSEISIPSSLTPDVSNGIWTNALAHSMIEAGTYNISFLDDIQLIEYRESLFNGKLAALQKDSFNCIPFCLFVNALIQSLKPGDTEFKTRGIPQFEQDFGVRVLKREELIKPRVRIV